MRVSAAILVLSLLSPFSLLAQQKSDRQKVVDIVAKDLKSRDAATRADAAESLGKLKIAEAIEPLVMALGDRDASVRRAAASGLWTSSDVAQQAIPALRNALADPEPSVVIRAAGALISMDVAESELAEPLRGVLARGDEVDRFLAARALIGIEPAEKLASPMLDYLRRNAPDPKNTSADSDNFRMGSEALRRLCETGDRSMISKLMIRINENPHLTEPILLALGKVQPPPDKWVETLLVQLPSSNAKVRESAVELLGKQKAAAEVKLWVKPVSRLIADPQRNVRDEAIRSLKEQRGFALEAIAPMLQAVKSESDPDIRARAAEAVGEIADAAFAIETSAKAAAANEAMPVLIAAAEKDANIEVRRNALRSLDRLQLDPSTAVDVFARAAVEQKDFQVRSTALRALKDRGKDAASAEEKIRPLLNDPEEWVRLETTWTIDAMKSARGSARAATTTTAAVDPAARDKALQTLRDYQYQFTEEAFFSALNDVELDIVTAFLDAGMSPSHRFSNSDGNPPLRVVLEGQEGCHPSVRPTAADTKAIVKLLLARGADPNVGDANANTPLMTAVQNCDPEIIKILLAAKADMYAKNGSDMTAFEFGVWGATDGAYALVAAGYRLSPDKVKIYNEAYANDPKKLDLVKKATKAIAKTPTKK